MSVLDSALATHGPPPATRSEAPPVPTTIRDTGLTPESVTALALKILYVQGAMSGRKLAALWSAAGPSPATSTV